MTHPNPTAPFIATTADLPPAGAGAGERETIERLKAEHAEATEVYRHYVESLRAELAKRDETIASQETELNARRKEIKDLEDANTDLESTIYAREQNISRIDHHRDLATRKLAALRDRLSAIEAAAEDVIALRYMACMTLDTAIYKLWLAKTGIPSNYAPVVVPTATPSPAADRGERCEMSERERRLVETARAAVEWAVDANLQALRDALAAYATPGPSTGEAKP